MKCADPMTMVVGQAYPCGRCLACRVNRRREWSHRLLLEMTQHGDSTFVTLTYDDEHLPRSKSGAATLAPDDLKNFLKRFRSRIAPTRIRFYGVGEYGETSWRPHYHLAVFGWPNCHHGISRYRRGQTRCCSACDTVRDCWGRGNVFLGTLERRSAQYIAGYVVKRMTRSDDPRLGDRVPEFSRMSKMGGGLGYGALDEVAKVVQAYGLIASQGDVPSSLRHGSRVLPLGRYLRRKLRAKCGLDENAPKEKQLQASKELLPVRLAARSNPALSVKGLLRDERKGMLASLESRERIRKKRGNQ